MRMFFRVGALVLLGMGMSFGQPEVWQPPSGGNPAKPDPGTEEKTQAAPHPAAQDVQEKIVAQFAAFCTACESGDVDGYLRLRDPEGIKEDEAVLAKDGRKISPDMIKPRKPLAIQRILGYPVLQAMQRGERARLTFFNEDGASRGYRPSQAELIFVLFRKDKGEWKVVRFGPISYEKKEMEKGRAIPEDKIPQAFHL